ncbi:MAG: hypothetical protein COB51_04125 [Moraxellaceae bacterium]|nr:MAG: hypothetical protein COB51_04125 [Moraxellaceae bacterium]
MDIKNIDSKKLDSKSMVKRFRALDVKSIKDPELREKVRQLKGKQDGFTLLELLVVIAIMATLAGSLLVSYDGLQGKADKAQATFNLAAIDQGVRTFKVVTGDFPNRLDNLIDDGATAAALFTLPKKLKGKISSHTLTIDGVDALAGVGIDTLRLINETNNVEAEVGDLSIPNRAFDDADRGLGEDLTLAVGSKVAVIEFEGSVDLDAGDTTTDSSRLRDIAGLDAALPHLVIALGVGNNSSIVSTDSGANAANFSQAPFYGSVDEDEYGRFVVLFHIATDEADDGTFDPGEDGDFFEEAKFIGVVDTFGDWLDEELAEFTGQKS